MGTHPVSAPPTSATDSVLLTSEPVPEGTQVVHGVDFDHFQDRDITAAELVDNLTYTGFQGSAVAEAACIINEMVGRFFILLKPQCQWISDFVIHISALTATPKLANGRPSFSAIPPT